MAQNTSQQIFNLLAKSTKILITTKVGYSGDGLASCLAWFLTAKKMNKNAEIIIDNFKPADNYNFLPEIDKIKAEVKKLKNFIISLDISQTGIEDLSYDLEGNNLRIHLSPKKGAFNAEDLKFETGQFAYDLIIVVDTAELESLGRLYSNHRDLFYQIPVINIDHQPGNEQFGHVNLVDFTAASTSEIIYKLLKSVPDLSFDARLAECLLTGIISKTQSFKTDKVSPEILSIASELINLGADRQKINTNLYQTKTIPMLKLWGKVLSRLEAEPEYRLVWSKLDLHDFTESGGSEKELNGVVQDLIANTPLAETILIFYQLSANQTKVLIHSQKANALNLSRSFMPEGDHHQARFNLPENLDNAIAIVLPAIKNQLTSKN